MNHKLPELKKKYFKIDAISWYRIERKSTKKSILTENKINLIDILCITYNWKKIENIHFFFTSKIKQMFFLHDP